MYHGLHARTSKALNPTASGALRPLKVGDTPRVLTKRICGAGDQAYTLLFCRRFRKLTKSVDVSAVPHQNLNTCGRADLLVDVQKLLSDNAELFCT